MNNNKAKATIQDRFADINERIIQICQRSNRDPKNVKLVVVTKTHPVESISEVIAAGARHLGENYVEEAQEKIASLDYAHNVRWHMVGHIQSRKTGPVAAHFDYVHSLDRVKIARRLDTALKDTDKILPVLLECNMSGEESKFGWQAGDRTSWESLAKKVEPVFSYPNIRVEGLMTMAPYSTEPENSRPFFRLLRELGEFFAGKYPQAEFNQLSMGMSGDYEVAIEEGATMLRIGTAIMGERDH